MRSIKSIIADVDTYSRMLTSRKLSENLYRAFELYKQSSEPLNTEDDDDCELLGVSPNASKRTIEMALKAFMIDHHPDKFQDPALKAKAEVEFKEAKAAFDRIKERRDWK